MNVLLDHTPPSSPRSSSASSPTSSDYHGLALNRSSSFSIHTPSLGRYEIIPYLNNWPFLADPTNIEKETMTHVTGLTLQQITTFFLQHSKFNRSLYLARILNKKSQHDIHAWNTAPDGHLVSDEKLFTQQNGQEFQRGDLYLARDETSLEKYVSLDINSKAIAIQHPKRQLPLAWINTILMLFSSLRFLSNLYPKKSRLLCRSPPRSDLKYTRIKIIGF